MAVPLSAAAGVQNQAPVAGDRANAVIPPGGLFGTISAVGPTAPISLWGTCNVFIWGSVTSTTLATTAGSSSATVGSATNITAGMTINSPNVPAGTTVGSIAATTVTLAFPPGYTNANVVTGTDASPVFMTVATTATVQLERSFDGGSTWLICGVGGAGAQAIYTNPSSISIAAGEPEAGMAYRLNCVSFTGGGPRVNYRISATGQMAVSAGVSTV